MLNFALGSDDGDDDNDNEGDDEQLDVVDEDEDLASESEDTLWIPANRNAPERGSAAEQAANAEVIQKNNNLLLRNFFNLLYSLFTNRTLNSLHTAKIRRRPFWYERFRSGFFVYRYFFALL